MSNDQRPGRVVMIDSGPLDLAEQKSTGAGGTDAPRGAEATAPPKSRILLSSALFLIACIAGAAGMSLLPLFRG